jgi:hypothetical protein
MGNALSRSEDRDVMNQGSASEPETRQRCSPPTLTDHSYAYRSIY